MKNIIYGKTTILTFHSKGTYLGREIDVKNHEFWTLEIMDPKHGIS